MFRGVVGFETIRFGSAFKTMPFGGSTEVRLESIYSEF